MATTIMAVNFTGTSDSLQFANPTTWICWTFNSCDYWETARSISWANVPANNFAMFFETDTCHTGDTYHFISDQFHSSGTHTFENSQPIRSMMIGTDANYTRRPSFIYFKCPGSTASKATDLKTSDGDNSDGSITESSASSNWFNILPDNAQDALSA